MAKKKETKKDEPDFDYKVSLDTYEISEMLRKGFIYYITINDIKINSEKELTTILTKFKQANAGE